MDNFKRIVNPVIKSIDGSAIEYPPPPTSLKNRLKTVKTEGLAHQENGNIHGRVYKHTLSQSHDNLASVKLQVKITTEEWETSFSVESAIGLRLFKEILIKTASGVVLQHIRPEYLIGRLRELAGNSSNYWRIVQGVDVEDTFGDGSTDPVVRTDTFYIPLFLWFEESVEKFLKTRSMEAIVLEMHVADRVEDMGFSAVRDVPVLAKFEAKVVSTFFDHDDPATLKNNVMENGQQYLQIPHPNNPPPPKHISGFDVFYEDNVELHTGQTSAKILLRCGYPLYKISCVINDDETVSTCGIDSMRISVSDNREIMNLSSDLNYSLCAEDNGYTPDGGPFSYWFSSMESRKYQSGLLTFSRADGMYPAYLELSFPALTSDCTLRTHCEYVTRHEIKDGKVLRDEFHPVLEIYRGSV